MRGTLARDDCEDVLRSAFHDLTSKYTLDKRLRGIITEAAIGLAVQNADIFIDLTLEDAAEMLVRRAAYATFDLSSMWSDDRIPVADEMIDPLAPPPVLSHD